MVDEVWLHIGTPKSGTSSLQKYLSAHREVLAGLGLTYLAPPGRGSANDLAVAWNNRRHERIAELAEPINRALVERPEPRAMISSEMFYGTPPEAIFTMFPALRERRLNILVYMRRQDRYIEAKFLQKSKNARFDGTIFDFIEKFKGSGADYAGELAPWQAEAGDVQLVPRVLEPARLSGGDVVSDAMALIGLKDAPEPEGDDVNVSPGLHRVQLLQAASRVGIVPPRRLQRLMAANFPQDPTDRAPILGQAERRAFLDRHKGGNEELRARYFPDWPELFQTSDLDRPDADTGIAPFTKDQLSEITNMLSAMKLLVKGA